MKQFLFRKILGRKVRIRILRCYIFTLHAFEMWLCRRILQISYVNRINNEVVLRGVSKDVELPKKPKVRKLEYFGQVMRITRYNSLQLIIHENTRKTQYRKKINVVAPKS